MSTSTTPRDLIATWHAAADAAAEAAIELRADGMFETAACQRQKAQHLRRCANDLEACLDAVPVAAVITPATAAALEIVRNQMRQYQDLERQLLEPLAQRHPQPKHQAAATAMPSGESASGTTEQSASERTVAAHTSGAGTDAMPQAQQSESSAPAQSTLSTPHLPEPCALSTTAPSHHDQHHQEDAHAASVNAAAQAAKPPCPPKSGSSADSATAHDGQATEN